MFRTALILGLALASQVHANECTAISSLSLQGAEIELAEMVAPGTSNVAGQSFTPESWSDLPLFCRVVVSSSPSPSSDIKIEVWMPTQGWNGQYIAIGNGGWAGVVPYAALARLLKRGFAVSGTDTGHTGQGWDASFARNQPDLLYDFARRSVHEMARASKIVIREYYDQVPSRSYFKGCSTGGRQALVEAQEFPNDFDGIISIAPATDIVPLSAWFIWVAQAVHNNPKSFIEPEKYPLIHKAVMNHCDATDGVVDGVIRDGADCYFDPAVLLCENNNATALQVEAVRTIYDGPTNPRTGERIAYAIEPGAELLWATLASNRGPNGLADTYFKYLVFDDDEWDFQTFDFDADFAEARKKDRGWLDATDPNLDDFERGGGKLLIVHGRADQYISPQFSIGYYESVLKRYGDRKRVEDFARLFLAPGMYHCGGGTGPSEIDYITVLDDWVERGVAPDRIIARHPPGDSLVRSRPLCPYPLVAKHSGSGSTDLAENFICRDR